MTTLNVNTVGTIETAAQSTGVRWPSEHCFLLKELETLRKVRLVEGDWLGVYGGIPLGLSQANQSQELLCASRSPVSLYRKLRKMAPVLPVMVRRTQLKAHLPQRIEPAKPDRFDKLCRSAYEAVADARQLLDPDSPYLPSVPLKSYEWFVWKLTSFDCVLSEADGKSLYEALEELCGGLLKIENGGRDWIRMRPDEYSDLSLEFTRLLHTARGENRFRVTSAKAQGRIDEFLANSEEVVAKRFAIMRKAADFLRTLSNKARNKGSKAGDRSTGAEVRKALSVLHRLAQGEHMKAIAQVAIDGQVDDPASLRRYKSLDMLVSRFSKRVARAVQNEYGLRIVSLDYNHLFYALRDWPWIDRRRDRPALMEATRRGLPHLPLV